MSLKELRTQYGLTQQECADIVGIPLRTYVRYEKGEYGESSVKYRYIVDELQKYCLVDEEHGLLSKQTIVDKCAPIFDKFGVRYAYLFGSYAKGTANEESDVDLLVAMPVNGFTFYEMAELLRQALRKKVDLLDESQLNDNNELVKEILSTGEKIYGTK